MLALFIWRCLSVLLPLFIGEHLLEAVSFVDYGGDRFCFIRRQLPAIVPVGCADLWFLRQQMLPASIAPDFPHCRGNVYHSGPLTN